MLREEGNGERESRNTQSEREFTSREIIEQLKRDNHDLKWDLTNSWKTIQDYVSKVSTYEAKHQDLMAIAQANKIKADQLAREKDAVEDSLKKYQKKIYPVVVARGLHLQKIQTKRFMLSKWKIYAAKRRRIRHFVFNTQILQSLKLKRKVWSRWLQRKLHAQAQIQILATKYQLQSYSEMKVKLIRQKIMFRVFSQWKDMVVVSRRAYRVDKYLYSVLSITTQRYCMTLWRQYVHHRRVCRTILVRMKGKAILRLFLRWKTNSDVRRSIRQRLKRLLTRKRMNLYRYGYDTLRIHTKQLQLSDWLVSVVEARESLHEEKEKWSDVRQIAIQQVEQRIEELQSERERFQLSQSLSLSELQKREMKLRYFVRLKDMHKHYVAKVSMAQHFERAHRLRFVRLTVHRWRALLREEHFYTRLMKRSSDIRMLSRKRKGFDAFLNQQMLRQHQRRIIPILCHRIRSKLCQRAMYKWHGLCHAIEWKCKSDTVAETLTKKIQEDTAMWSRRLEHVSDCFNIHQERTSALQRQLMFRIVIGKVKGHRRNRLRNGFSQWKKTTELHCQVERRWKATTGCVRRIRLRMGFSLWRRRAANVTLSASGTDRLSRERRKRIKRKIFQIWKQWTHRKRRDKLKQTKLQSAICHWKLLRRMENLTKYVARGLLMKIVLNAKRRAWTKWYRRMSNTRRGYVVLRAVINGFKKRHLNSAFRSWQAVGIQHHSIALQKSAYVKRLEYYRSGVLQILSAMVRDRKSRVFRAWFQYFKQRHDRRRAVAQIIAFRRPSRMLLYVFTIWGSYVKQNHQQRIRVRHILHTQLVKVQACALHRWKEQHSQSIMQELLQERDERDDQIRQRRIGIMINWSNASSLRLCWHSWKQYHSAAHKRNIRVLNFVQMTLSKSLATYFTRWSSNVQYIHDQKQLLKRIIHVRATRNQRDAVQYWKIYSHRHREAEKTRAHRVNLQMIQVQAKLLQFDTENSAVTKKVMLMWKLAVDNTKRRHVAVDRFQKAVRRGNQRSCVAIWWQFKRNQRRMRKGADLLKRHHHRRQLNACLHVWLAHVQKQLHQRSILSHLFQGTKRHQIHHSWRHWVKFCSYSRENEHFQREKAMLQASSAALARLSHQNLRRSMFIQWKYWIRIQSDHSHRIINIYNAQRQRRIKLSIWKALLTHVDTKQAQIQCMNRVLRRLISRQCTRAFHQWKAVVAAEKTKGKINEARRKSSQVSILKLWNANRRHLISRYMEKWKRYRARLRWIRLRVEKLRCVRKQRTIATFYSIWKESMIRTAELNLLALKMHRKSVISHWRVYAAENKQKRHLLSRLGMTKEIRELRYAWKHWYKVCTMIYRRQSLLQVKDAKAALKQFQIQIKLEQLLGVSLQKVMLRWKRYMNVRKQHRTLVNLGRRKHLYRLLKQKFNCWRKYSKRRKKIDRQVERQRSICESRRLKQCVMLWRQQVEDKQSRARLLRRILSKTTAFQLQEAWFRWHQAVKRHELELERSNLQFRRKTLLQHAISLRDTRLEAFIAQKKLDFVHETFVAWKKLVVRPAASQHIATCFARKTMKWRTTQSFYQWKLRAKRPVVHVHVLFMRWKHYIRMRDVLIRAMYIRSCHRNELNQMQAFSRWRKRKIDVRLQWFSRWKKWYIQIAIQKEEMTQIVLKRALVRLYEKRT